MNRISRLYPALWASIPITCLTYYIWQSKTFSVQTVLANFTMLQSFMGIPHIDESYWTLSIQLIVYVVFAMAYFLSKKDEDSFVFLISIWFLVDCCWLLANQFFKLNVGGFLLVINYINIFILGLVANYIEQNKESKRILYIYVLALLLYSYHISLLYMLVVIFVFSLIFIISYFEINITKKGVLVFFGSISYPFYLIHQVVGYSIISILENSGFRNEIYIFIPIIINAGIAYLISRFVEKPIIKYCRKLQC